MKFGFREMIFILLLVLFPLGAYFGEFKKRDARIELMRDEIRRKQEKLSKLETATRKISDLGAEIDKLTDAIEVIEQRLPDERKVDEVLKQVWELATRQRLLPKRVVTDKPVPTLQYSELPIQMEIVGDFDGFYSFMLELEKLPRIMQLPKMKLTKLAGKDAEEGQMKAEIILSVFFEADDSQYFGGSGRRRGL